MKAILIALCSASLAIAQTIYDPDITVETAAIGGLNQPIAMEFLRNDSPIDMFIAERTTGKVKFFRNGAYVRDVLDLTVNSTGERGLLGMARAPDFETTGHLYVYYCYAIADGAAWVENRVERYRYDGTNLVEPTIILAIPSDPLQTITDRHQSGPILFGPDGKLYGMIGDMHRGRLHNPRLEQNTDASAVAGTGGIYRLNPDGTTPSDNPFVFHPDPWIKKLIAYGVRNTFGLTFDPRTGQFWMTDNGPDKYDEVNPVNFGFNSGWLKIMGPDARNATYMENNNTAFNASDLVMLPGAYYSDPEFNWLFPIGVTSILFPDSARYDDIMRNSVLIAGSNGPGRIYRFPLNSPRTGFELFGALADKVADNDAERLVHLYGDFLGTPVDFDLGPDGYWYKTSLSGGRVWRIRPTVPPTVINGETNLANFRDNPAGTPLNLTLMAGTTTIANLSCDVGAFGRFSVRAPHTGSFTVVAKADRWLSVKTAGVTLTTGGFAYLRLDFPYNGDVNGDNAIDDSDLSAVLTEFGAPPTGTLGLTDLDGNGIVDDADLAIVLENFGRIGED
ncbi:MAG: PQQ-dependent sugar dehydrogenase [Armatimonadetes bacterium]|nr:PQQ-dependent sugar dehydrogenase [Armatimonadota bacterium]